MQHKTLKLISTVIVFFALSVSVCPQSKPASSKATSPAQRDRTIFVFHTDEFWLNLHHFLYVLGRAVNKDSDTTREAVVDAPADQERGLQELSANEQKIWSEAVASYAAGLSKKDIVFDAPMPALTGALARAADAKSLTGTEVDTVVAETLERAAPVYRKAWWKKHHDSNRNWKKAMEILLNRHGATVLAFITNAYKLEWPAEGFPVHVSAYTNWAGAYSTRGNLLVVASQSPSLQESYGFETIFHEGMHQWDIQLFEALRQAAIRMDKFFPRGLTHGIIFFTAGEAVRRVIPGHVPYAEKFGVWQRGMSQFRVPLEETWKPYLDGRGTREEAFAELIKRTAVEPPKKP